MDAAEAFLGGNRVWAVDAGRSGISEFANKPYCYNLVVLKKDQSFAVGGLQSATVHVLAQNPRGTRVRINGEEALLPGDTACADNCSLTIQSLEGEARILVAGGTGASTKPGLQITRSGQHYKVTKPWGHELWIKADGASYCLKEIFLKQGSRTSLQYHHFKEETNVLLEGRAQLVYKANDSVDNDAVSEEDLGMETLCPISVVHVTPRVLHRIVAETDVMLYETSTPHLDDVIRVQDDSRRVNGRILAEHAR